MRTRAWRRPLTGDELAAILASYRADRADGVKHDPAFRAALTRILSSPWFLYRVEQPATGPHWQPVSGDELATRLSFLLWDSIPDDELRAKSARLHEPVVLEGQLRRMLKDVRMRGMAREFGARWLGVRDFVTNHGRNLKQFPEFTPTVRDARIWRGSSTVTTSTRCKPICIAVGNVRVNTACVASSADES